VQDSAPRFKFRGVSCRRTAGIAAILKLLGLHDCGRVWYTPAVIALILKKRRREEFKKSSNNVSRSRSSTILANAGMMPNAFEVGLPTESGARRIDMRVARAGWRQVDAMNITENHASRVNFDLTFFRSAV
jgi:hypothetical protein